MEYKEFVRKEFEKIDRSDVFLSLVTGDYQKGDCQCALEIGLAVLLDKSI